MECLIAVLFIKRFCYRILHRAIFRKLSLSKSKYTTRSSLAALNFNAFGASIKYMLDKVSEPNLEDEVDNESKDFFLEKEDQIFNHEAKRCSRTLNLNAPRKSSVGFLSR